MASVCLCRARVHLPASLGLLQPPSLRLLQPQLIRTDGWVLRDAPGLGRGLLADILCRDGGEGPYHHLSRRECPLSWLNVKSFPTMGAAGLLAWFFCWGVALEGRKESMLAGHLVSFLCSVVLGCNPMFSLIPQIQIPVKYFVHSNFAKCED